jgi:hypothetical protein
MKCGCLAFLEKQCPAQKQRIASSLWWSVMVLFRERKKEKKRRVKLIILSEKIYIYLPCHAKLDIFNH